MHFLDLLVGPRCAGLAVERPEQYYFNPDQLLLSTAHLMLRLAERPEFVRVGRGGGAGERGGAGRARALGTTGREGLGICGERGVAGGGIWEAQGYVAGRQRRSATALRPGPLCQLRLCRPSALTLLGAWPLTTHPLHQAVGEVPDYDEGVMRSVGRRCACCACCVCCVCCACVPSAAQPSPACSLSAAGSHCHVV